MVTVAKGALITVTFLCLCSIIHRIVQLDKESQFTQSGDIPISRDFGSPFPSYYRMAKADAYFYRAYYYKAAEDMAQIFIYGVLHNSSTLRNNVNCSIGDGPHIPALLLTADGGWTFRKASVFYTIVVQCVIYRRLHYSHVTLHSGSEKIAIRLVDLGSNEPTNQDVAVCVKPLFEDEMSFGIWRTVEWFEMHRLVGLSNFFMYDAAMEGEEREVLHYYENLGVLKIISFPFIHTVLENLKTRKMSLTKRQKYVLMQELYLVALNDCLHRNKHKSHILVLDLDEVLLPNEHGMTVNDVIKQLQWPPRYKHAAAYLFQSAYFFDDLAGTNTGTRLFLGSHIVGTSVSDANPKPIIVTKRAAAINRHSVTLTQDKIHKNIIVPPLEYGFVRHYKGDCAKNFDKKCNEMLRRTDSDYVITKYLPILGKSVDKVMNKLGIFNRPYN